MTTPQAVRLVVVDRSELVPFARRLQTSFALAAQGTDDSADPQPIPSDSDIWSSFDAPGAQVLHVLSEGRRVGGAVVQIDERTQRNSLDLFFVDPQHHGTGVGFAAWQAIERRFPRTKVWETMTPHFEVRNIHFYVNKCGFHIVEFYHPGNPEPERTPPTEYPSPDSGPDLMFRFEKIMNR